MSPPLFWFHIPHMFPDHRSQPNSGSSSRSDLCAQSCALCASWRPCKYQVGSQINIANKTHSIKPKAKTSKLASKQPVEQMNERQTHMTNISTHTSKQRSTEKIRKKSWKQTRDQSIHQMYELTDRTKPLKARTTTTKTLSYALPSPTLLHHTSNHGSKIWTKMYLVRIAVPNW